MANILVSEYFGLPSSLDENTQKLLDQRLRLAYKKERLTDEESAYSGPHILDRWLRCNHIRGINPKKDYTDVEKTQTIQW